MPDYKYLIIGGGMTAESAVKGIRQMDADGSIGLISIEAHPPYNRPPLSKGLWKGKPLEKIWRAPDGLPADLHLGHKVEEINPQTKTVRDKQGETYTYAKLLLATGARPRRLPFGGNDIIYYRTLDDYQRLHGMAQEGDRFAVIGGGFIGSEIAAALAMNKVNVVMLFPKDGIGANIFPQEIASYLNDYYREKGVEVLAGDKVEGWDKRGDVIALKTSSGKEIEVKGVVAGIGVQPNVELAQAAKLKVDNGIIVDEQLRTNDPNIYAAGDVASFYNPALDMRLRVEHEDNANKMGEHAGKNMAGANAPYHHLPFFYSDMFEAGYEAVGELDSRLEVVADWKESLRKGVLYYMKDGRVRGVLLWDVWGKVDAARELIAQPGPFSADDLKGKIAM